jgi:hypothetical protein
MQIVNSEGARPPHFQLHDRVLSPAGAAIVVGVGGAWVALNLLDKQGRRTRKAMNCDAAALKPLEMIRGSITDVISNPYTADRQPRTRRFIQSATPAQPVPAAAAAKVRAAVREIEQVQRTFKPYEPREGTIIILPGMAGGYQDTPAPAPDSAETRAEQLKRESNERIMAKMHQQREERANVS